MKNEKGITLESLVITIIVLLILSSVAIYSGTNTIKYVKFNKAKSEMQMMQANVNSWYEEYKNGNNNVLYYGVATNDSSCNSTELARTVSATGITSSEYRYLSNKYIKETFGTEVEYDFLVNVAQRDLILFNGIIYQGEAYFTLEDFEIYNINNDSSVSSLSFNLKQGSGNEIIIYDVAFREDSGRQVEISKFNVQVKKTNEAENRWKNVTDNIVKFENAGEPNYKFEVPEIQDLTEATEYNVKISIDSQNIQNISSITISGPISVAHGSGGTSNLTSEELSALETNGIAEITGTSITNDNLKDTSVIKAVITDEVPIPVNATYKEGTESTGVVIEFKGSEFVWVPVPEINKMVMCDKHTSGDCDIHINEAGTGLECRTEAHKVGGNYNTEIVGRLYATATGESFNDGLSTQTYSANSGLREPAIVTENSEGTGTSYDGSSDYYNTVLGYNSSADFLAALKLEYKTMALSVAKYGGFYIGRYETSIDGTTVASKGSTVATGEGAIMPMSAATSSGNRWYGMYSKQKAFSTSGLQSSMIWGSQYDAMLKWVLTGTDLSHVTATTNGNHSGSVKGTGSTSTDKMNNIYDLEGNLFEWTLEAYGTDIRVGRGSIYSYSRSPSSRSINYPSYSNGSYGSRLSLYIK